VAVCCQRLEFLAAHRLLVPRCEILLPTSGAKGTIRGGSFSQIATVLQSGGEEGMWTYDRYQRWMDQVTDWVRPPTAGALRAAKPPAARAMPSAGAPLPPKTAAAAPAGTRPAASPAMRPAAGIGAQPEDVIEVPAEDMDLAALAELAKKVVERKP
jgi:twitching motility protein PilT